MARILNEIRVGASGAASAPARPPPLSALSPALATSAAPRLPAKRREINYTPGECFEEATEASRTSACGRRPAGEQNFGSHQEQVRLNMAMLCPRCHGAFSIRLNWPKCGVRLEYRDSRRRSTDSADRLP